MNTTKQLTSNDNLSITIRNRLTEQDYQELKGSGLTDEAIFATGHFSIQDAQHAKKAIGIEHCGLVFNYLDPNKKPYLNSNGKPWYRIKPRDVKTLNKYDTPPKYLSQYKEGCRPYFSAILKDWDIITRRAKIPIWITEGEKKADLACSLGIACIGLGGVSAWRDRRGAEVPEGDEKLSSNPLPELEEINWENREVILAFDSDVTIKKSVQSELFELSKWLKEQGAYPHILLLPNELDGSKNGIDDFVIRHGETALRELEAVAIPALKRRSDKEADVKLKLNLEKDPSLLVKITMAWVVLKEKWAYRPGIGWHKWVGTHWVKVDDGKNTQITRDLIKFIRKQKWESQALDSFIQHLKSLLVNEQWNQNNLLALKNGTLDTKTNTFVAEHRREDWITSLLPFDYDPNATCPLWRNFLNEAMEADQQSINILQAFFRWVFHPKTPNEPFELERALDLVGLPGTGKGTVLYTLQELVGKENCGAIGRSASFGGANLASLIDKRVSINFDASGYIEDPGLLNTIISNEAVQIKRLYNDVYPGSLNTILVRAYNRFLEVPSGSEGLDRRIIVIKFNKIPESVDTELKRKLKEELAGIFQWVWSLSFSECKKRLKWIGNAQRVIEGTTERFEANNPVFRFLCETYPEGLAAVKPRDLFDKYKEWCSKADQKNTKERTFYESIQILGINLGPKTNGYRFYQIPEMKNFDVIKYLRLAPQTPKMTSNPCPESDRDLGINENTPKMTSNPYPEPNRELGINEAEKKEVGGLSAEDEIRSIADYISGLIESGQGDESSLFDGLKELAQEEKIAVWKSLSPDHQQKIRQWKEQAELANKPAVQKIGSDIADGYDGGFSLGETVVIKKGFHGNFDDRLVLKKYLGKGEWLAESDGKEQRVSAVRIKKAKDKPVLTEEPSIFDLPIVENSIEETGQKSEEEFVDENAIATPGVDVESVTENAIKAISLWQPWASLCAIENPQTGKVFKQFETRTWRTDYRGKLIIHAAKKNDKYLQELTKEIAEKLGIDLSNLPFGCAIAECDLVDCVEMTKDFIASQSELEIYLGDWSVGRFAWKLENVRPINPPIPLTGHQKLWDIKTDLTPTASEQAENTVSKNAIAEVENKSPEVANNYAPGVEALSGRKLAKRLKCSASVMSNRPENFTIWTRKKDPEGIGWVFNEATSLFTPETSFSRPIKIGDKVRLRKSGEGYDVENTGINYLMVRDRKGNLLKKYRGEFQLLEDFYNTLQEGTILKALTHDDHKHFIRKHSSGTIMAKKIDKDGNFLASVQCGDDRETFNLEAVEVCGQ